MTAKLEKVKAVKQILAELCQTKDAIPLEIIGYNTAYRKIEEIQFKLEEIQNAKNAKLTE